MYAVIKTGGKQYRVKKGEHLKIESLDVGVDDAVEFDTVMLISQEGTVQVGKPFIEGGLVKAKVNQHGRHKKVNIIKFKRRKHHMKRMGHRQNYTEIEITDIISSP